MLGVAHSRHQQESACVVRQCAYVEQQACYYHPPDARARYTISVWTLYNKCIELCMYIYALLSVYIYNHPPGTR